MKTIKVSNCHNLFFMVDDEDYFRVSYYKWSVVGKKKSCLQGKVDCNMILLPNYIMNSTCEFDHKDRNYLNNQKKNLKECTHSQNCANKLKFTGNYSSKYKGVSWIKSNHKWRAVITVNYNSIHLGCFISEKAAAKVYNEAAIRHFGEFAVLNVIED